MSGPPPPPPSPTSAPKYAQLNAAWKQLSEAAVKRVKANPGERDRFVKAMTGIPQLLRGGKFPDAQKRLAQLAAMLKIPPPPPPPISVPKYAQMNAAWKQMSEQVAKRIKANPKEGERFTKAMAGIPELLRGGKFPEAQKRLDQLAALLKVPPPPPPPPTSGPKYAELNERWKHLSQEAGKLQTAVPGKRIALTQAMAGIPEMLQSGKLGDAQKRLVQLATAIKAAEADAKAIEALKAEWKKLEEKVKQAIAKYPGRKADLVRATAGIGEMVRVGKAQLAKTLMAKATTLLGSLAKG